MTPYHIRFWLNKSGIYATSTITAFHGMSSYHDGKEKIEFEDKKLTIHDCQQSIRIHQMADQTDQEYIDKIRLIANVCINFANHLEEMKK